MDWIAKIINGTPDEFVHAKVLKYGVGEHPGPRAYLTLSSKKVGFKADLDLEKVFVRAYAHAAPDGEHRVSGVITTYTDRQDAFSSVPVPLDWRKAKGKGATTYKAKLKAVLSRGDLEALLSVDDPTTFYLLTLVPADGAKPWKVATKTKFPKTPAAVEDESAEKDPVFCKGALGRTEEVMKFLYREVLPDVADIISDKTKRVKVRHKIVIEDIEIPDDAGLSFAEKRRLAKKTGRLVRVVDVDGEVHTGEYPFRA